jgi:uncharacterized membrane protein
MLDFMRRFREYFLHRGDTLRDDRWIFTTMLIGSLLSLIAAFVLSVEAIELAKNPHAALSCNVNAILNCATVNNHPTGTLFGFPNSFIGLMTEPIVITVAIAGLARVRFPRAFMFAAQLGYSLGFAFAILLFCISFFVIQALCPWCLLVTLTTTLVWFSITRYNIRENNLFLPAKLQAGLEKFIARDYDKLLMVGLIVVAVAAILFKYGDGLFA